MKNLEKKLRGVLERLSESGIVDDFYLAGGTALYLRYHHRVSEDLDFFLDPEKKVSFEKIGERISKLGKIEDFREDTLIGIVDGVRVSFFEYPYPLIKPLESLDGIFIASDVDIACMKSVAIIQRGIKKDFYDLWYLMRIHKWKLRFLIDQCRKKYGEYFNQDVFLKALVFFEDAEKAVIPDIDKDWDKVKEFFRRIVLQEISKTEGKL